MGRHSDTGTAKAGTAAEMRAGDPPSSSGPADQSVPTEYGAPRRPGTVDETQLIRSTPSIVGGPETEVIPSVGRSSGRAVPHEPPSSPMPEANDDSTMIGAASHETAETAGDGSADEAVSEQPAGRRSRAIGMWLSVVVFWLVAMPIGVLSAVIVAGRRATLCSKSSTGFGCSSTGSAVGVVLLVLVVVVVGTVSVYAYDARRTARRWGAGVGIGVGILAVIGLIAWLVVRTIQ